MKQILAKGVVEARRDLICAFLLPISNQQSYIALSAEYGLVVLT